MNKATIMIIEDESIIAKDIECILKNYKFNIAGPYSRAEEAINALTEIKPDLILMDIVLKGDIDGIEAANIIKQKISVPIIYLTAYADDITIDRIKSTEPYGYFLKPFEEKELYTWIETTLHKFKEEEKLKKEIIWMRSALNSFNETVIGIDDNGIIKFISDNTKRLTGYNDAELLNSNIDTLMEINHLNKKFLSKDFKETISSNGSSGYSYFGHIKCKNNKKQNILYKFSPIENSNVCGYIITIHDEENKNEILIKELNDKLESSKNELNQFAYAASHDLQEPLRMIASYVQLLQKRYQGKIDSGADEFISFAVEGVNRMKTLLNDILVYSRLNTTPVVITSVDSNVIVQQTVKSLYNDFPNKAFKVNYDTLPVINADSSQMRQMFYNLLSNAIKFNDKETAEIDISCINKDNKFEFKISDNGIGMDSEYYPRIFEVFQKLHNHNEYPGTGIGLAICKKIAENHSGTIKVESVPSNGSTFFITISDYYG